MGNKKIVYLRILILLWFFIFNYNISAKGTNNPFDGMILTSITIETNIDGFNNIKVINIKSNIKKHQYLPAPYIENINNIKNTLASMPGVSLDPVIWIMQKDFDSANISSKTNLFNSDFDSDLDLDFDSVSYFKLSSFVPGINNENYYYKNMDDNFLNNSSDMSDVNTKLPSDLNYENKNTLVDPDNDSIIFKKLSQDDISGVGGESQTNIKDMLKKFTSIKVSPHTVVSSLNYNLSNDFSINAQWEVEKPNTSRSKVKKYISDGTANNRPVSLYSFAVNMIF